MSVCFVKSMFKYVVLQFRTYILITFKEVENMNLSELKDKIKDVKYKVISFDIFDTLIKRPCVGPTDILKLVGKRCGYQGDFLTMRRIAEKEARNNKLFWEDEIVYDDIYKEFERLFDISHELVEDFKRTELDVEYEYLYARESMHEIFEYAINVGKEVIIVSDIYLPYDFMEKVLKNCGYTGYNKLYLSSEYKVCKNTGKLYEIVKKECLAKGIEAGEILHLGDNENSDVNIAQRHGLSVQFIPRIEWLYRKNRNTFLMYDYSVTSRYAEDTFLIGWAINRIYDDPFIEFDNATYFNGDLSAFAQLLLAPMTISFLKQVMKQEKYYNASSIRVCAKKECFAQKIMEIINFVCKYGMEIGYWSPESEEAIDNVNAVVGDSEELRKMSAGLSELCNVRLYSPYASAKDCALMNEQKVYMAKQFDFDTNRTVPIMQCLINTLMFEETGDTTILKMRKEIDIFVRGFMRMFQKDFDAIRVDFTLFAEFYERFLMNAKKCDAEILKDISVKNSTLYDASKKNLYEQWYKSHNK